MVVGVFPAIKLGVLFVKQISKPMTQMFIRNAKNHPFFRTYFIIPPAQFYHWAEVKAKMYLMNLGKPTKVAKLNETMAIELGASLLGEIIIFSVAGGCLIFEYTRQVAKETKKEEARLAQMQKFTDDIESLHQTTSKQEEEIRDLLLLINELAKHTKCKLPDVKVTTEENKIGTSLEIYNTITDNAKREDVEAHRSTENQSLIHRAIMSFKKNVESDKLS
ncbi:putative OPA3-like protein CG13603 [Orussus abietinus]|uniref:putative OPA3-like protein CG13603 n=1 Tax=Orussus abietinus TaxID=222816 RepID=UPI0006254287|nr:putative OPA3-like protein CG13603 [Orussus abietinus]XP_012275931.1 putative OPA3-like protein CG13603 [Orussus abietinus]